MMLQLSLVKVTNFVRTVPVPIRMFYNTEPKWPLEKCYTFYPWFFGTMAVPILDHDSPEMQSTHYVIHGSHTFARDSATAANKRNSSVRSSSG